MIYGYCRTSTGHQQLDTQERNILCAYPETKNHIFRETFTGISIDRPQWNKLYARLQKGDTVVFDSVSRMSRSADDGVALYMQLFDKGIELVFLKEPQINTSTYREALQKDIMLVGNEITDIYITATNKVLKILAEKQIRLAFEQAEKEVKDLRQRTREGILTARLKGKQIGMVKGTKYETKKSKEAKPLILKYSKDFNGSLTDKDCMKLIGISNNSYYKYKAELKNKINQALKDETGK